MATRTCDHGHEYVVQTSADVGNCSLCKLDSIRQKCGEWIISGSRQQFASYSDYDHGGHYAAESILATLEQKP